jgi:hypothetical protein
VSSFIFYPRPDFTDCNDRFIFSISLFALVLLYYCRDYLTALIDTGQLWLFLEVSWMRLW